MPIIKLTDVGSIGYVGDVPSFELPESPLAWSSARNMMFRAGLAERVTGYATGFDPTPTQVLYGLFPATQVSGTSYLVGGGTNKIFCYNGITETDITGTTIPAATADTKWTGGVLTGFVILNESTVAPQYIAIGSLGTATNVANLTAWPSSTTCKALRTFKYFIVAGNMTESSTQYPYKLRWSNSAVPGALPTSWTASTTNDAGSVDLSADDGEIVDMIPFGDQMAIYREYGIVLMRYVGGTDTVNRLVMAFNRVPVGANGGMMANNCGADVSGVGHVVLGNNDVYVFDGTRVASVMDKKLRRWLFENISTTRKKRSFVVNNSLDSEIWICFPTQGSDSCDKAIIWNYSDNTTGIRDLPTATAGIHAVVDEGGGATWNGLSGTWDSGLPATWSDFQSGTIGRKTVISSAANKIYVFGNATDAAGSTLISELGRDYISFGDAQRVKYFRSIWPRFEGASGQVIEVVIGTSMSVDELPTWQDPKTYTIGTSRKIDVNKAGRFMSLRVRSSTGVLWKLKSADIDFQPQGLW